MSARPDIVFLLSDQHARRVTGAYGEPLDLTPSLDRLASEGTTWEACYTPSPICGPSRMAMLTGRHPHRTGCWTNNDMLPSDIPTYAHALSAAGYRTLSAGRLHALGPDQLRGFSAREVGDHSPSWPGAARHDMGVLRRTHGPNRISLERVGAGNSAYQDLDEATLSATLRMIDDLADAREAGDKTPFFLQVGFMLPHPPYVARPADLERFLGAVSVPRNGPDEDPHPWISWWRENRGLDDLEDVSQDLARAAYYALVRRMDAHVGRVLARLEERGLCDNLLTAYASDHGDHLGERGLWWKHTMYEDSVTVPLILRWPGVLEAGSRVATPVSLLDLAATFTAVAGAASLPDAGGTNLLTETSGAGDDRPVFSEYCTDPGEPYSGDRWTLQRMVRCDRWKLILHDGYPPELFDIEADPEERNDISGHTDSAEMLSRLSTLARAGWNPADIRLRMTRRAQDKAYLRKWAEAVSPSDTLRWAFDPAINRLDDSQMETAS